MKGMLRVAAFTQGRDIPSARFRVRQYLPSLQNMGIEIEEWPAVHGSYPPRGLIGRINWLPRALSERRYAILQAADANIALIQREMISTLSTVERLWKKPVVFDVDDAIWLHQRFGGADNIAKYCGTVICGNAFLAEHFSRFSKVTIIPTGVDTARYVPGKRSGTPLLCWSGSASGLPYLEALETSLKKVLDTVPRAKLRVICNKAPRFIHLSAEQFEFVPWSEQVEVVAMQSAWIGLMPMPDTDWTRGKCSFKMLTYMSCAVPAVVSPWGMNHEVLSQTNGAVGVPSDKRWTDILIDLLRNPNRLKSMGTAGRDTVVQHYSVDVLAGRLADVLRTAAGN